MEQKTKRREWVKTAAIIFLAVLLVLTFFSNTIMNRSLPEVAAQYVQSGTINAKIRGTGTISANETYDVTIQQSRKVQSVLVRVGDTVSAGDTLFILDAAQSSELAQAQDELEAMELAYQKRLIELSNTTATENHELQQLRDDYNEALALYKQYSNVEASKLKTEKNAAEATLKGLQRTLQNAEKELSNAQQDQDYLDAQQQLAELKGEISSLESEIEGYEEQLETLMDASTGADGQRSEATIRSDMANVQSQLTQKQSRLTAAGQELTQAQSSLSAAQRQLATDEVAHGDSYRALEKYAKGTDIIDDATLAVRMQTYASDKALLREAMIRAGESEQSITDERLDAIMLAYSTIHADQVNVDEASARCEALNEEIASLGEQITTLEEKQKALSEELQSVQNANASAEESRNKQITKLRTKMSEAQSELTAARNSYTQTQSSIDYWQSRIDTLETAKERAQDQVDAQQDVVDTYTDAMDAANQVELAQKALEEKTFSLSLGDSNSLDVQNEKEQIEKKKEQIAELEQNADAQEVTANVSGTISAIHVTAGSTASAEVPMATITVNDRGYTVQISATAEQAKRVTVGDQATISNYYYGDTTATLEKIANDPQNPGKGKLLIFRLTGSDIEAGANITLSIGQKSATYDALVPNSAVRTDSNGSFVLVVTTKSTPLSNRYVATRVDVTVLASDDTSTAVSGLSAGDFVITTSTRPIEAGDQVRMVEAQ